MTTGKTGGREAAVPRAPVEATPARRAAAKPENSSLKEKSTGMSPADKYITERDQKRCDGFDIPKYVHYHFTEGGSAEYRGARLIDGQALALLKVNDEVMVVPVDEAMARRLKRVAVGQLVGLAADGIIRTKGRSR